MTSDDLPAYRAASEALHRDQASAGNRASHYRTLWECGLADLIREDFYSLLALPQAAAGSILDAGCGTGLDTLALRRRAPALAVYGVDISAVALAGAANPARAEAFYQAALEFLPFAAGSFDYVCSHEVVEHLEEPSAGLREFWRVLKPGGVCVVATPNGASWWIEHLRQRLMRLGGRRGAPVGEDHTRSPRFWRRELRRAGFVVERQMFDGAALEFLLFVAPARWMPVLTRIFEPLRALPGINLALCDRVKFRLRKPGQSGPASRSVAPCCPICHTGLAEQGAGVECASGHRFGRNTLGLIDFVAPLAAPGADHEPAPATVSAEASDAHPLQPRRPIWLQRLRRLVLRGFGIAYGGGLVLLAPLGMIVGLVAQPFARPRPD